MEIKIDIRGSLDPLFEFLNKNIGPKTSGYNQPIAPYKGTVTREGFLCTPSASSSSIPPRIKGEIISLGNTHTVTIKLRRMFRYHLMIVFLLLVPCSTIALYTAISIDDYRNGFGFSFSGLLVALPVMLVVMLPFLWIYIVSVFNAKKEMRDFCEEIIRAARPH
ncbi:MAG TPA: hypothetical protein VK826_18865 [Bacteroidia bacterium]|nr:hypothetical protein [Bacteroidia bacterium]